MTINELRAITQASTPGPWQTFGAPWRVYSKSEANEHRVADLYESNDTRYMATFDPVLVAAMLDVIKAADELAELPTQAPSIARGVALGNLIDALTRFREVAP